MARKNWYKNFSKGINRHYLKYVTDSRAKFLTERISLSIQINNAYIQYAENLERYLKAHSLKVDQQLKIFLKSEQKKLAEALAANFQTALEHIIELGIAPSKQVFLDAVKAVTGEILGEANVIEFLTKKGTLRAETIKDFYVKVNKEALDFYKSKTEINLSKALWEAAKDTNTVVIGIIKNSAKAGMDSFKTSKLLKDYIVHGGTAQGPLIRKLKEGGIKKYYVPKDVKFEALRLVRTETSLAFAEGVYQGGQATPFYKGINWVLSASHDMVDECDDLAAQGFFPDGEEPIPPHPQCLCAQVPVYESPEEASSNLKDWLRNPASQPDIEDWFNKQFLPNIGG